MIENSLLRQFAQEVGEEVTSRLVSAFDEATRQEDIDPNQAVLEEAIRILRERIDESTEH